MAEKKLHYSYEAEYPYFIRIIDENGQSVRLPADQYGREFTLDPNHIMLTREEFSRRLGQTTVKKEKLIARNQELW